MFYVTNSGTIQGSILGPILYKIYVSPLFDFTDLSNFADDNLALTWNVCKQTTIANMELKLEWITLGLKQPRLKVNEEKTGLCLFFRKDTYPVEIILNDSRIKSVTSMNVPRVCFDSNISWSKHISNTINKANKALHALKKNYFTQNENFPQKPDLIQSYINVHHSCNGTLPYEMLNHTHLILLHKLYNTQFPKMDWIELNFNQTFTSRETLLK